MNKFFKQESTRFSFGFYKRKALFFVALFFLALFVGWDLQANRFKADQIINSSSLNSGELNISVEILKNGKVKINGNPSKIEVDYLHNELRLPLVDNPQTYYDKVTITLTLPKNVAKDVVPTFYSQHGVGDTATYVKSANQIVYEAHDVSSSGCLSILASLPDKTVQPSLFSRLSNLILGIKNQFWLFLGLSLPMFSFLLMIFFLVYQYKRQKVDIPDKETDVPPMAIPPAVVGALFNQKVGARDIAATLIDLAERGDIVILDRDRGFAFGKGRFDQRLLAFEKILLSKIFNQSLSSDRQEIERRVNDHFYSKKMSMVAAGITALATRLGYFKVNPQKSLSKYRLMGIFFFLIALAGFIFSIIKFTDPPFIVFLWVGMMISSLIISVAASRLPIRTIIGQEVLSNWYAFKKFLSNPTPFPYSENNQDIFQKYLPYAIVMNCEVAWARRFQDHNFIVPDWFLTDKSGLGLEDFCLSLFPIVSYVGRSLSAIREPGFE